MAQGSSQSRLRGRFFHSKSCQSGREFVLPLLQERALFFGVPRSGCAARSVFIRAALMEFAVVPRKRTGGARRVRYLKEERAWDLLEFSDIPDESTVEALVGAAQGDGFRTAKIPLRPNPIVGIEQLEKLPKKYQVAR
jgi:hypothetical protein